ncbi:MAG: hypothetical protein ACHP9Z_14445 [Streptosporangiales bacterium]
MTPAEPELAAGAEAEPAELELELEPELLPELDEPESSEPADPVPDCDDELADPVPDWDDVPAAAPVAA